jgi:hypothetical protein
MELMIVKKMEHAMTALITHNQKKIPQNTTKKAEKQQSQKTANLFLMDVTIATKWKIAKMLHVQ